MEMDKQIGIRIPNRYREQIEKARGDKSWLSLLIDGARHRGEDITFVAIDRAKYKTHYYCSRCEKWFPHKEGIYKVARAFVRCPICMLPLRTRGLKSNSKNWTEWEEE